MDGQDRRQFVQQYVERQKAYLPTYTTEHLLNERHATPCKPLRSDEFGFDTPVLRPRVPANKVSQSQPTPHAGTSKESRTRKVEPGPPSAPPEEARSKTQDGGTKDKSRSKRKKASTPTDTDNERAARLADRRERKRKKRAIVNPPQKHDDDTAPRKGRANNQKAKKPAALALLYGFSATNVTKNRLTVKPAPSLGVFSKGRASTKKKVTVAKKSSSRNEFFSESAFLNKSSERVADQSKIDDDSEDGLDSPISNHPQVTRITNRTKDRDKCTQTPIAKTPQASARTTVESEVWDIELQSKLPTSAGDVSSEPGVKDSTPVVLDLHGAEWSASIKAVKEHEEYSSKVWVPGSSVTPNQSRGHFVVRNSPLARSDPQDGPSHAAGASSIHPSHSASQVGRRAADAQSSELRLVTSKYFTDPKPAPAQELAANPPQTSRSNDGIEVLDPQIATRDGHVQTSHRVASPMNSLISAPRRMVEFQTRYDMVPLEFPSDGSPYDDYYTRVDVPWESPRGSDRGYFEPSVVESHGHRSVDVPEYCHPQQGATWDWYQSWRPFTGLAPDDADYVTVENDQGSSDPLAPEHEDDLEAPEPCFFEAQAVYDSGECFFGQWAENRQDLVAYEAVDGSILYSDESSRDEEPGGDVPAFLEGRALLLGVPEDHRERPRSVGLPGLIQAEMDVASRLRDHWRPLRL